MKANKKAGGLKSLLLLHCEKAVVLAIVLAAGWLAYASLGVESENRQPSQLAQAVEQTRTAFTNARLEDAPAEEFKPAPAIDPDEEVDISVEAFPLARGLNEPVVPPTIDRTDPTLLAATDLEVNAVSGLMAFVDENVRRERELEELRKQREQEQAREKNQDSGEDNPLGRIGRGGRATEDDRDDRNRRPAPTRRRNNGVDPQGDELIKAVSCAIVLAKAPLYDQYKVYKDALETARDYDPSRDVPSYFGYFVERAQVVDGAEPQWRPVQVVAMTGGKATKIVSADAIDKLIADWAGGQEPLVDGRFEHPSLTTPLPPLVGKPWGAEVVHSDAPLQSETDAEAADEDEVDAEDATDPAEGDDLFARRSDGGREGLGRRPGGQRGGRGGGRTPGRGLSPGGMRGGEFEGGMGRGMGRSGGPSRGRRGGGGGVEFSEDVPFAMIRFFDHTVRPGKRYRYRVRLILEDVNHDVDERALAREVIDRRDQLSKNRRRVRFAPWSKPSPVVGVPLAGDAYLASVTQPSGRQAGAEGKASFVLQAFALNEDQKAIQVAVEDSFQRGAVFNLTKDAEFVTPDRRWIEKYDGFAFRSGVTLVDYDGGAPITRDLSSPGKVLLMDATGRLFVRNEPDDYASVQDYEAVFKEEEGGRGGRGGRGFPGGEGMFEGLGPSGRGR